MLHDGDLVKIKPFYLNPEACACSTIEDSVFKIDAIFNRDGHSMCAIEGFSFLLPEDAFIPVPDNKAGDAYSQTEEDGQQNPFGKEISGFQETLDKLLGGKPLTDNPQDKEKENANKYAEWDALIDSIGKDDPPNRHYSRLKPQPIEYMQQAMTAEQFQGFCLGNVLKYALRFGHKDYKDEEAQKMANYARWLANSAKGDEIQI